MDTNKHRLQILTKTANDLASLVSPETRRFVALGDELGWEPIVLGRAPLPEQHVRIGDWLAVPMEQDSSAIPQRALKRVQAMYAAGVRPKGFVMVHEAPALLAAPPKPETRTQPDSDQITSKGRVALAATAAGVVVTVVAVAGAVALAVAAVLTVAAIALPLVAVAGAVSVDPILVAVTEDGYWIEIDRWTI